MAFSNFLIFSVMLVGIIAVLLSLIDEPAIKGDPKLVLNFDYRLDKVIDAPALSGVSLSFFSWVFTNTPLRLPLFRTLLNKNGLHLIRELASKFPNLPPLYYPVYRLQEEELEAHLKLKQLGFGDLLSSFAKSRSSESWLYRSIIDYHEIYKSGTALPSAVMESVLKGCEELQSLHAFASLIPEDVRQQAAASDSRWKTKKPLSIFDGVPIAVKDMIYVKGHVIHDGSKYGEESETDDTIISRLREAGAIIFGVTVMTEGGVTPLGYNSIFQGPFNPHNVEYYPGGSSSGSAVAVASGLVPVAIGFDGGGSIRIPCALSGLFGLAATFARIPFEFEAQGSTMVKAGPMTGSVADLAFVYKLLAEPPDDDHFYRKLYGFSTYPPPRLDGIFATNSLEDLKLGICWDLLQDGDPENVQALLNGIEFLKSKGARILNISIPNLKEMSLAHGIKITSEFALFFDKKYYNSRDLESNTRLTIALGKTLTANEVIAADRVRHWAFDYLRKQVFSKVDVILSHTVPIKTPKLPPSARFTGENNNPLVLRMMKNMFIANFAGLPALTIPASYTSNGLPVGIQVISSHWTEHLLIRIANTFEKDYLKMKKPRVFYDPLKEFMK